MSEYTIKTDRDSLIISGPELGRKTREGKTAWNLLPAGGERFLLLSQDAENSMAGMKDCFAKMSIEVFGSFLAGLIQRNFTGAVSVDMGRGVKKILFEDGDFIFASSTLIDDRLGEVIYRAGMITLEQMVDSAVQVDRTRKFGQVLIQNHIFSSADLWEALKLQFLEIFRSLFFAKQVYVQVDEGIVGNVPKVLFEDTIKIIKESSSIGMVFRSFLSRVHEKTEVIVNSNDHDWVEPEEGTFESDFLQLVEESSHISDIVKKSKLRDINTYIALFNFFTKRKVTFSMDDQRVNFANNERVKKLKNLLDMYDLLLRDSRQAFKGANLVFPKEHLLQFVGKPNNMAFPFLYLGDDGEVAAESVINLFNHCSESDDQFELVRHQLKGLINFLLLVTTDLLPGDAGYDVKDRFLELTR